MNDKGIILEEIVIEDANDKSLYSIPIGGAICGLGCFSVGNACGFGCPNKK